MLLKDNRARALKGFLYGDLIDSKKMYIIAGSILSGYLLINIFLSILSASDIVRSNSNGGALNMGFMTSLITMFISAIVMAAGREKKSHFVFPIDRLTYTVGNFIMFFVNTAGLLLLSTAAYVIEVVFFGLFTRISDKVAFINTVNLETYFLGLWISFWYILFVTTLTYLIFMLFSRFKLIGVISFGVVMLILVNFAFGRGFIVSGFGFFIGEKSPVLLSLKLMLSTLILQALSFLPLKNAEVNG